MRYANLVLRASRCWRSPTTFHVTRICRSRLSTTAAATSSVNEEEINFFSRLASQWWDENGEFGLLHKMNPVRMQFIREKLVEAAYDDGFVEDGKEEELSLLEGLDVLDVGCGGGLLSESLARLGANTIGVDASASNIAIASLHASQDPTFRSSSRLAYRNASAEELVNETPRFDVVCSMEVLEHVDNPAAFLRSCAALVKPGGHLFLSTVSRTPLAYFLTIFAAENLLRLVEPGTHSFDKYVKPSELVDFFRKPIGGEMGSAAANADIDTQRPWISTLYGGSPPRSEAEVRGIVYVPWKGSWALAPRGAFGTTECNYLFWVRKPRARVTA